MKGLLAPSELAMMRSVFRRHAKVTEVRIFGSRAKGTDTSRSDIDLALYGNLTPLEGQAVASELDDLPLPYKYDIQVFGRIQSEALREHIRRVGLSVFPDVAAALQLDAAVQGIETCYADLRGGHWDWSTLQDVSLETLRALVAIGLQEAN